LLAGIILAVGVILNGCVAAPKDVGPVSLAVWDLEALGPVTPAQGAMGEVMAARIVDRFSQSTGYEVVERQHLLNVLEEQHIGSSQLADEQTRLRLGRIIGCRQMVFGTFQVIGNLMRLDLRTVDVSTGRVLKTASATASANDLNGWLESVDQATGELIQR